MMSEEATVTNFPITDGSTWYRTGRLVGVRYTTADSDVAVTNLSFATHAVITGKDTLWKSVVLPGDILYLTPNLTSHPYHEITKVISDVEIKVRIPKGFTTIFPTMTAGNPVEYSVIPIGQRSPSNLASQIALALQKMQMRDVEMTNWLSGTKDGGPNSDGRYPFTTVSGQQRLVPCPALLGDTGVTDDAGGTPGIQHEKWNGVRVAKYIHPSLLSGKWVASIPVFSSMEAEKVFVVEIPAGVAACEIELQINGQLEDDYSSDPNYSKHETVSPFKPLNRLEITNRVYIKTANTDGTTLIWRNNIIKRQQTPLDWSFGSFPNFVPGLPSNASTSTAGSQECVFEIVDLVWMTPNTIANSVYGIYYGRV